MTAEPKEMISLKCKQSTCHIPASSSETNNTLQSHNSVEILKTESPKTSESQADNMVLKDSCLAPRVEAEVSAQDCGRERLKRHQTEVAGRVLIPEKWGHEELMKDWIDYSSFDALLAPSGIMSAREALVAERRRGTSRRLRIEISRF
ncbi:hypothetical protein F0562_001551 [Nyssa sinensis]|uniref:Protein BIC1 n=1 Tax=Nyssa sinensis TaxID=561372 RepID=A0A5J5C7I3_9ASTE|nr:hypothetical protein F0562_001551 [Nyssa sinensis]